MARVALINPPVLTDIQLNRTRSRNGHLGLGYIGACLLRDGHDVIAVDAKHERLNAAQVADRLYEFAPDIVGVTAMTHEIFSASAVCEKVKSRLPQTLTMVGGPHATALPERTLEEFPAIDIAVVGEGEETACAIARQVGMSTMPLWEVNGIAFRKEGRVVKTDVRPWHRFRFDTIPCVASVS